MFDPVMCGSPYSLSSSRAGTIFVPFTMAVDIPKLEAFEIILHPTGVAEIAFNRPQKYNALNRNVYGVSRGKLVLFKLCVGTLTPHC
jgi:hypothetical protein